MHNQLITKQIKTSKNNIIINGYQIHNIQI
jgi:hypothetical protein